MSEENPDAAHHADLPPKHYFVDEAGDGTLFNGDGKVVIGNPGISHFFCIGLLDVPDPDALAKDLNALRDDLINDPILKQRRQFDPKRKQTALFFHAKDDPVEVRWQVFKTLLKHDLKFSAVVKSKWKVLDYVRYRNRTDGNYRYHANELYDFLLRRLFKERLHLDHAYKVAFAIRGDRARSREFRTALETARDTFVAEKNLSARGSLEIIPAYSKSSAGLQAVDYFLWSLQRVFEKRKEDGCDLYLKVIWDHVSVIIDLDDTRKARYGRYYTRIKPLLTAALPEVEEYRTG